MEQDETKQLDSGCRVGGQLQPPTSNWQIIAVAALFLPVPTAILAVAQESLWNLFVSEKLIW